MCERRINPKSTQDVKSSAFEKKKKWKDFLKKEAKDFGSTKIRF